MKLKKKSLSFFFIIKNLNPVFFELLLDSIKEFNENLEVKNNQIIKLRKTNKTVTLFLIYINLFSTKKINTQKNEKRVYVDINRVDLIEEKGRLLYKVLNKELKTQHKVYFLNRYLNRYNKINTFQLIESTQIIQNLRLL